MKNLTKNQGIAILIGIALAASGSQLLAEAHVASDVALEESDDFGRIRVIVRHNSAFDDSDLRGLRRGGGQIHRRLAGIGAFAASLTTDQLDALAFDSRVKSISPDRIVVGNMDTVLATLGSDRIAENLGYTGSGVTVALIDSGIAASAAVPSDRIRASVDFTAETGHASDSFGHGTHVAGIIGGSGADGAVLGVAPEVEFVSLKVLDGQGAGYVSDVIDAVEWAIVNRGRYGIDIVNLSLGHPVAE
jgi:serine protease AprX